jgi:leucyl aminopeptidase
MDERSDLFRTLPTNSLIVPSQDVMGAYESLYLSTYHYQQYLSKKKEYKYALMVDVADISALEAKTPLYDAIYWARDMINMPPKDMNPESMVRDILNKSWNQFNVEIFDKARLEVLGCNLLLAVGAGSAKPPYMVVLTPKNPPKTEKYALIGKGVTFDAGGIQIKPDTAMLDMKCDMSGAAGMIGVARYLDALSTLPVDVTIAIGLTENMTGDDAFKPLDIYTAYN